MSLIKIINRRSQLYLADLAQSLPPVAMSPADMLIFAVVLENLGETKSLDIQSLTSHVFEKHIAFFRRFGIQVNHASITQKFNQLLPYAAHIDNKAKIDYRSCDDIKELNFETFKEQDLDNSYQVRLPFNFNLDLNKGFFTTFSPTLDEYVKLTKDEALILSFMSQWTRVDEVIRTFDYLKGELVLEAFINKMIALGLLVSRRANDKDLLLDNSKASRKQTVNRNSWQATTANSKIPIYFFPHMENHYPLALGLLFTALQKKIDEEQLNFFLVPLNFLEPNEFINGPYRKFGPGIWLFSNYMWSLDVNMQVSKWVKGHNAKNIMIHGGPSTPEYEAACKQFFRDHQSVDVCVFGEGEQTIVDLISSFSSKNSGQIVNFEKLRKVDGVAFRYQGNIERTNKRTRMEHPDAIESPYLNGVFDNYSDKVEAAIVETNRGCPFGCTFCDWGSATNQKVRKIDIDRSKNEISWIGENQIGVLWIADANFGMYDRDIEVSQHIVETKAKYGYPKEVVVNYTKNTTRRLLEIIKIFNDAGIVSQGIISIQTTDEYTLDVINRKNIKTKKYDELTQEFFDLGLPISTDLMIGLPGATRESFVNDIQKYIDDDVAIKAYPTQVLPNSPMADPEYMKRFKITTDQNNYITSTSSFSFDDLQWKKKFYDAYAMADGYGLLRYVLRYLQWEKEIKATTFIAKLLDTALSNNSNYPILNWATIHFSAERFLPSSWNDFYREVVSFCKNEFSIDGKELDNIIKYNRSVMPEEAKKYPFEIAFDYDVEAYFKANNRSQTILQPLAKFSAATAVIDDDGFRIKVFEYMQYDNHQYFWELKSSTRRPVADL